MPERRESYPRKPPHDDERGRPDAAERSPAGSGGRTVRDKSPAELNADLMDVHVVDILGHVEALLRSTREIQRGILKVRGAPPSLTGSEREQAASDVRQRVDRMLKECDSLRDAVSEAVTPAGRLRELTQDE
jgi:hypothetical protein